MATRKKKINDEATKIAEQLKALQDKEKDLIAELEALETKRIEDYEMIQAQIGDEYFAGVILNLDSIHSILQKMIETGKAVQIPFNLYMKED